MQNLVTLFGAPGAARFLQLLASPYRKPAWELVALNENGTTAYDLTPYLRSSSASFTDEMQSDSALYVLANPNGLFDRYASGPASNVLAENRLLRFRKGLVDPVNGTVYLLPGHYGRITRAHPTYRSKGDPTIEVTVADLMRNLLRQKVTTYAYENWQANAIASDLLERYPRPTLDSSRVLLTDVDRTYAFAQFPDFGLADALKVLYDPLLFYVRADEAGRIATGPRLGSALSSFSGVLGYPDQATAPPSGAVAYTIPDSPGVESIDLEWQDYEGAYNQVKVLGKASAAQQSLGPSQPLYFLTNSSIGARDHWTRQFDFSENSASQNRLVARNVFVQFEYSTNHQLGNGGAGSGSPRIQYLTQMVWRGDWAASGTYQIGEGVSYMGVSYACIAPADGTHLPTDEAYWEALPFDGPFVNRFSVYNEDPKEVGYVSLDSVVADHLILRVEGRQYSEGGPVNVRHHGGFDFRFTISGQPVLSYSKTITAYSDYNTELVVDETLTEPFGDHKTFQSANAPFAMSTPVEVFINGTSQGIITADQSDLSGESNFAVDYERGRVVLNKLLYQVWSQDQDGSGQHPYSTGGNAQTSSAVVNTELVDRPAPNPIYRSRRDGDSVWTFDGLTVGQGYDLRLHFNDPDSDDVGHRVFAIYAQSAKVVDTLDIFERTGAPNCAWIETLTGISPDANGKIELRITQHDPASGDRLPDCPDSATAIISAIEVLTPQGQGPVAAAVNCGGPAVTPTPPLVTANYGYSPVQGDYGIQSMEINNPLISTREDCQSVADFWVNHSAWQRHKQTIRAASIPHLQPGDLVRYYNPRLQLDMWMYLRSVARTMDPSGSDADTLDGYLIYAQRRV